MNTPTVFLSSTFADFTEERDRLMDLLPYVGVHVISASRVGDRGKPLHETLHDLIDLADMVVLLVGSRAGTISDNGEPWTMREINYAFDKGKRVFAYLRQLPKEYTIVADTNESSEKLLREFHAYLQRKVAIIPRYKLGECCKLTTAVVRDVARYAWEMQYIEHQSDYQESFE